VATVVTDAHLFRSDRPIDLSRLNDSERQVLRMLGEGHTAKSIANALGSTPAAVNERLREARRKTGVGSSRELARVLRAQENRHEQMGMGKSRPSATLVAQPEAETWRPQTGVFAMIAVLVAAAAAGAVLMNQAPTASTGVDPLIGTIPSSADDPARVYARIRTENRDPAWAPRTEDALRADYATIAHVGAPIESLRVTCARTLCEVAGIIDAPPSPPDVQDLKSPVNRTMQALQGKALHNELVKIGLENLSGYFGGGKPGKMVFLQYWSRKGATAK
jgi:DNA-binding CsgD family transcriptional regulator